MPRSPAMPPSPPSDVPMDGLELLEIATLRPHPRNDRSHPPEEIEHLKQSITEHGVYRNVVVAQDGTILAGRGVVEAAAAVGLTHVPGQRRTYGPDDPRALKILVGDNHIARLSVQDDARLAAMLQELAADGPQALLGTGFDETALLALVTAAGGTAAEPPEEFPEYGEDVPTEYRCPQCGYEWSGKPAP